MPMSQGLKNFFAPPEFLEVPRVGLDIGADAVRYVKLRRLGDDFVLDQYGKIAIAQGVIVAGEIVRAPELFQILMDIRNRTHFEHVRISVAEDKSYFFKTEVPLHLTNGEVWQAIEFKLEESVPLALKDAVFGFDHIFSLHAAKTGHADISVSVAPLKTVSALVEIVTDAGFLPTMVEAESKAVARALVKPNNEQIILVVNIRNTDITLSLVVTGTVYTTATVAFGSNLINEILARELGRTTNEVIAIKEKKMYTEGGEGVELFGYILNTISALGEEIKKFRDYSVEKILNGRKIDRVLLTGKDARLVGLVEHLRTALGIRVETGNPWSSLAPIEVAVPEMNSTESLDYACAIGLALINKNG